MNNITIGSDPELFIVDTSKNNKIISSIGLIPGKKKAAFQPAGYANGFGVETDNILAEFNIPPSDINNSAEFVKNILLMKEWIRTFVKSKNSNYDILNVASALVDDDQLNSPEAKEIGCEPDYNVYTRSVNPKPTEFTSNLRTTGTHIHIGFEPKSIAASELLIRYMDMYVGIPSVLYDIDTKRRQYYGNAGSFRLTPYGVEYRVLSGYFIKNFETIEWVVNQTKRAISAFIRGNNLIEGNKAITIINNLDAEKAIKLASEEIKRYNIQ